MARECIRCSILVGRILLSDLSDNEINSVWRDVTGTVSVSELRVRAPCCDLSLGVEVTSLRGDTGLCALGERSRSGEN